jgi:hypothetical protein
MSGQPRRRNQGVPPVLWAELHEAGILSRPKAGAVVTYFGVKLPDVSYDEETTSSLLWELPEEMPVLPEWLAGLVIAFDGWPRATRVMLFRRVASIEDLQMAIEAVSLLVAVSETELAERPTMTGRTARAAAIRGVCRSFFRGALPILYAERDGCYDPNGLHDNATGFDVCGPPKG